MAPQIPHNFLKDQNPQTRVTFLKKVMSSKLPFQFDQFVAQELMVSIDQAIDMIFEYRRFIVLYGLTGYKLYPSEQIEKVWLIHMVHGTNYIKFCDESIKFVPYHVPFTGNTNGYDDRQEYANTLSFYQAIFNEVPCSSCWPPADFRFNPENFTCMFVNLIRLAGMYWSNNNGNLKGSNELKHRGYHGNAEGQAEAKDKLKEKKKHKKSGNGGVALAAGAGIGAGVILAAGGLAIVSNPNTVDYNDNNMMDDIADGFHDGLSALTDISFGDMIDIGEGAMEGFEDIDWPDIEFGDVADAAGELFGGAGDFFENAGEFIGEGAVDAGEAIGEGAVDAGEAIGDFVGGVFNEW